MWKNKKGAALLQVLLITAVLAGIATMLLRASLSRTTAARKTRRTVSAQMLVNSCMAEVNTIWSIKSPDVFARDLNQCIMYCNSTNLTGTCSSGNSVKSHQCKITIDGYEYRVTAEFSDNAPSADGNTKCELVYTIESDGDTL